MKNVLIALCLLAVIAYCFVSTIGSIKADPEFIRGMEDPKMEIRLERERQDLVRKYRYYKSRGKHIEASFVLDQFNAKHTH